MSNYLLPLLFSFNFSRSWRPNIFHIFAFNINYFGSFRCLTMHSTMKSETYLKQQSISVFRLFFTSLYIPNTIILYQIKFR